MKSDVERLSQTRVKFNVQVPFEDLADAVDQAYRRIAGQVAIPGFRKGKVPRQIIDQRLGRGAVLQEVVNDAVPKAYEDAVREAGVVPLGQPQMEVTDIIDGDHIAFTADVEVRPEFELPSYKGLRVEVDPLDVTDADVEEELNKLAARFGSVSEVQRPAEEGDVLLIDIRGEHAGEQIEDLTAAAMSYEVGTDGVLPGMDEAVIGRSAGEEAAFDFTPEFGEYEGKPIAVTVAVTAVREKILPDMDDSLATMASEFDTLDDLRDDLRRRLQRSRLAERGAAARARLQEELLASFDVPLPEGIIAAEVASHFDDHEDSDDEHRAEVERGAREELKKQFLFDAIADAEDLSVGEAELSQWLMMQAPRYGMSPDQFAQALVEAGQVPMAVADVRRSKAMAVVLQEADIVDTNGDKVDISELDRTAVADEIVEGDVDIDDEPESEAGRQSQE